MRMRMSVGRRLALVLTAGLIVVPLTGCGGDAASSSNTPKQSTGTKGSSDTSNAGVTVTLGYFPNLTHGSAIVGVQKGYFEQALGQTGAGLKTQIFDSGSDTIDALLSGSLDATYIGPAPSITAYAQSKGNVRVVSGATQGGAALVVSKSISSVQDLKGAKIATPSAGNTQDVALKYFLKKQGFQENSDGTGDVTVVNQDNSVTVQAFAQGQVDGGWLPEPYASELVKEGGHVLVNEKSLWPQGRFVTTVLLVNTSFMNEHPDLVDALLAGQVRANDYIKKDPAGAQKVVGDWLSTYSGSPIDRDVLDSAWKNLTFTDDPAASSLLANAKHAQAVGLLDPVSNLSGIFDLGPLNKILQNKGEPTVSGPSGS